MADTTTGVQVFVGPANQLVLGDVVTGPAGVTLETLDESHQRLNLSIPSPTQELVDATDAAQLAAEAAALDAETAATAAAAAQGVATTAQAEATAAKTAAQQAATTAANAAPTDAQMAKIVTDKLLPSNLALDTDGVPFISPGQNGVFVFADTDGRPYFVTASS
jgi:hypothetical protein